MQAAGDIFSIHDRQERNGRLLCSPRNPQKEAEDWLRRQNLTSDDKSVLVLGFGAGYHVRELRHQFPNLQIDILELDANFHNPHFTFVHPDNLRSEVGKSYNAYLAFRPAWALFEKSYTQLYLELTGRNQNPEEHLQNQPDELKIWRCLRELVK